MAAAASIVAFVLMALIVALSVSVEPWPTPHANIVRGRAYIEKELQRQFIADQLELIDISIEGEQNVYFNSLPHL